MMTSFYYYDENFRTLLSCTNQGFCYRNLTGITKLKYERKNEKDSGRSSKMTSSCKSLIQATFKALPILHRGIFCYQVEGERQKGARGGQQVIFLFPAPTFFQLKLLQRKELKATLSHSFTICFVYRNNTATDTRLQIMGLYINSGLSCQTLDEQVSTLITDADKINTF